MPFSPSDLSNLAGWWKADALSLSDGDPIGTWTDSSGNGKDLTQATTAKKPTFKTSILNSLPVARFDGGDQVTVGSFDLSATDKLTVFVVSSATSDSVGQILVEHGTDNNSDLPSFVLAVDGATAGKLQGATYFAAASTTASAGTTFHIFAVQFDRAGTTTPTQVFVRLDAETVSQNTDASSDVTGNFASKTLHVGARGASLVAPLTGDIAEIIVYSDFKSLADLNQVGDYLESKYGLTWTDANSRTATDSAAATETATRSLVQARGTADNASATETATRAHLVSSTDSAAASDSATRQSAKSRTTADNAHATETATRSAAHRATTTDAAAATETAARSASTFSRSITDGAPAFEAASGWVFSPTGRRLFRSASDRARATDRTPAGPAPPLPPLPPAPPPAPAAGSPPAPPYVPAYGFNIYDEDAVTLVGSADRPKAAKWLDTLRDVGSGTITLRHLDAARPLLTEGRIVKVVVDGDEVFAFVIDGVDEPLVSQQESSGLVKTGSGRGIGSLMDTGIIVPTMGFNRYPISDDRTYNFGWSQVDVSGWGPPKVIVAHQSDHTLLWDGIPTGCPDPFIPWIGPQAGNELAAPIGHVYLVFDEVLAEEAIVVLFLAADNRMSVYADTLKVAEIGSQSGTTDGFRTTKTVAVRLPAGAHRFAFDLRNVAFDGSEPGGGIGPTLGGNPCGMLVSAWTAADSGQLLTRLFNTGTAGWMMNEYPPAPPGPTVGQIVNSVIADNQALGAYGWLTTGFTDDEDSNGQAWPQIASQTFKTFQDVETCLNAMQGAGLLEWAVSPAGRLDLWVYGTRGVPRGVSITEGHNLLELTSKSRAKAADVLGVRWAGGQFLRSADGTGTGSRLAGLEVPAASLGEAEQAADAVLAINSQVRQQLTGATRLTGADVAYKDYAVADVVSLRGSAERVTQIVGEVVDVKGLKFTPVFRDVLEEHDERVARMVKQFASGSLAGQARSAAPALPPPPFGTAQDPRALTFQYLDPPQAITTPSKKPTSNLNLYGLMVESTTAAGSDTIFQFMVDGLDVLFGAGVYPAATKQMIFENALAAVYWCIAGATELSVNVSSLGYLVSGLIFTPLFV